MQLLVSHARDQNLHSGRDGKSLGNFQQGVIRSNLGFKESLELLGGECAVGGKSRKRGQDTESGKNRVLLFEIRHSYIDVT